jgi:hypothetical protein
MKKAEKHNYRAAIADYTAAIDAANTPSDVKAMAIYNRALAYSALHETTKAADDLEAVLKMPKLPKRIKTAALRRQERIRQRDKRENRHD